MRGGLLLNSRPLSGIEVARKLAGSLLVGSLSPVMSSRSCPTNGTRNATLALGYFGVRGVARGLDVWCWIRDKRASRTEATQQSAHNIATTRVEHTIRLFDGIARCNFTGIEYRIYFLGSVGVMFFLEETGRF